MAQFRGKSRRPLQGRCGRMWGQRPGQRAALCAGARRGAQREKGEHAVEKGGGTTEKSGGTTENSGGTTEKSGDGL